ncbi:UDP-N-acetylglucosamine 4-epimerase [Ekhidna lutea]|uniref:UDP-N-acetylglucosamine 4-epimerase n=1 Tax=Ekhidna lutea TaxID=447679 RepID=A0A239FGS8_EKHLU|nr:SDR family oxidoreductase [Ekhidna lutea]SNS55382.1 UDP-N-acetylglucosamine 4-epimerase [Ekhidna lutea]
MKKILVTGGAGFIGSNLVESLLEKGYQVVCLDNLATGSLRNIHDFLDHKNFEFVEGDILDFDLILKLSKGSFAISHQAALGSVPRSIKDPITSNRVNVEGTLNVFKAAVDNNIERVVYAASSSTYGDSAELPKKEDRIGKPLSPYAVTKFVNELYADVFHRVYGLNTIGLRYFNVFGPKQDPNGPYAAVIPLFIKAILSGERPIINGDGSHSRDFTFVSNAVQANIKALETSAENYNTVYNVACEQKTNLKELVAYINEVEGMNVAPIFANEREGDVKHSLADISKAKTQLGYRPSHLIKEGLSVTIDWYREKK